MPRLKREGPRKPAHRPQKPINWDRVDELLRYGCPGTEIAPEFDMCADTFYVRVAIEKGMGFTEYSLQKKSQGEAKLREIQYLKAIGEIDKGDNSLLIWLGKQRLSQKENTEVSVSPETTKAFVNMMNQLDEIQKTRQETAFKEPDTSLEEEKSFTNLIDGLSK
jgi:hypothetical protein